VDRADDAWRRLWPTIRLGMLTSVCGFASLLPSGFPGLAQLGVYSIGGLIAAALVTRFILPELKPAGLSIRDLAPLGARLGRLRDTALGLHRRAIAVGACALGLAALAVLAGHHATLWNHDLSALSPVSAEDLKFDAALRADLGTADVLDIVVVTGPSLESVLEAAEQAGATLGALVDARVIGGFDSPADYLPSLAAQTARRSALPNRRDLAAALHTAAPDLDIEESRLTPFLDDVDAARHEAPITPDDLKGTTLAQGFDALILHRSGRWSALLPLHAFDPAAPRVDVARIDAALADAQRAAAAHQVGDAHQAAARVLDMKSETDALYQGYLDEAIRLSLLGLALIVILLLAALRSAVRAARVLAPLALAVLTVAAGLVLCGQRLNLLHLVGMLLVVAVGSNYALFFDREAGGPSGQAAPLTLASLGVANLCTVTGFGLLCFSQVPVLEALGQTVAPGALLALLLAALMTTRAPRGRPSAHA
jgi:predicted exporter